MFLLFTEKSENMPASIKQAKMHDKSVKLQNCKIHDIPRHVGLSQHTLMSSMLIYICLLTLYTYHARLQPRVNRK